MEVYFVLGKVEAMGDKPIHVSFSFLFCIARRPNAIQGTSGQFSRHFFSVGQDPTRVLPVKF